jgi:hypothetical protein
MGEKKNTFWTGNNGVFIVKINGKILSTPVGCGERAHLSGPLLGMWRSSRWARPGSACAPRHSRRPGSGPKRKDPKFAFNWGLNARKHRGKKKYIYIYIYRNPWMCGKTLEHIWETIRPRQRWQSIRVYHDKKPQFKPRRLAVQIPDYPFSTTLGGFCTETKPVQLPSCALRLQFPSFAWWYGDTSPQF